MESNKIELGGLWENVSKAGQPYYSGSLGRAKLLIFQNKHKEPGSKQPDWRMYIVPGFDKKDAKEEYQAKTFTQKDQDLTPAGSDIPF